MTKIKSLLRTHREPGEAGIPVEGGEIYWTSEGCVKSLAD